MFEGAKLAGKIVNHTSAQRMTKYRVMLESLCTGQSEEIMMAQEQTETEARYFKQCTKVNKDMSLAVIHELEHSGLKWRGAPCEADTEMACLAKLLDYFLRSDKSNINQLLHLVHPRMLPCSGGLGTTYFRVLWYSGDSSVVRDTDRL